MKRWLKRKLKEIYYELCWRLAGLMPLDKKKIVFDNFNGLGYADNPKYIAEVFRKLYPDYKLVWILRKLNDNTLPKEIKSVAIDSWDMIRELSTAGFWINNVRLAYNVKKRKNQYYIQTWHGSYGGKKSEKDVEAKLSPWYLGMAKLDSSMADLFLSNARLMTDHYHKTYWYYGEVLECGFPRNDILINNNVDIKQSIRERIGITEHVKVLLYAPTFRDDKRVDVYQIPIEKIVNTLRDKFSCEWKVIYRMHPNLLLFNSDYILPAGVIDCTSYPDMQELLLISDLLLTDYSSSYLDFILMKKPVFFYMPDYSEFMKERDFHFDLTKLFIPCAFTEEELLQKIAKFQDDIYQKGLMEFLEWYKFIEDGHASEKVSRWIIGKE